jgi:RNA polymerase sigma-70 factor (ECF subfamily)
MNELVDRLAGPLVSAEDALAREFEARLADSSRLAVRVAYSVVRNPHDAEDVAQEAFARAHRRFSALRDRDKFRAWLVRMTWRLALDHRRGEKRRAAREEVAAREAERLAPDAAPDGLARERSERLWAAIDQLPEKLRVVIVLAAIEEQAVKEVATLLGAPEGTIKSRLFEARKKLQEMLR